MEREELEKMTKEYQTVQAQLQSIAMQRVQFKQQIEEYKEAAKYLENAKGKVYTEIGGLIVEATKEEASKSLSDRTESAEMRLSIVERQYNELSKKEETLRTQLTTSFGDMQKK
ncbi:Prefoldin beta- domain protein [mine drainage metagenome]|uniref:Prefoldin beta-domain protein n=1 Tax=mine drainage metagenome TaxID=410659 RepID=T0YB28_9ZZZZ